MKVLIIIKQTNLERHGDFVRHHVAQGSLEPDHAKKLEIAHDEHYRTIDMVISELNARGVAYQTLSRTELTGSTPETENPTSPIPSALEKGEFDGILCIGGDGTVLSASQMLDSGMSSLTTSSTSSSSFPPFPWVAGIRSSPSSVGYLCCCGYDQIPDLIEGLVNQKLTYLPVQRLKTEIQRVASPQQKLSSAPILNDILFANSNPAATTRYKIRLGEWEEEHKSSGIWIATAAGSTAAIAAAGGISQSIEDTRFQFYVRELYQVRAGVDAHLGDQWRLQSGVFSPPSASANPETPDSQNAQEHQPPQNCVYLEDLHIESLNENAILAFDGQHRYFEVGYGDKIRVTRAQPLNLIRSYKLSSQPNSTSSRP